VNPHTFSFNIREITRHIPFPQPIQLYADWSDTL
jgi:hypothetical protein